MSEFLTASNIVGVDIGNLTTIAYSTLGDLMIESRVRQASRIDELGEGEIFGFGDKKLITNSGTFENDIVKFRKNNFLILLNYAIAKVTDRDNVKVVIGIPAGQYSNLRDDMKNFIISNNQSEVRLGNKYDSLNRVRNINIEDVFVVPEGYGLKTEAKVIEQCKDNINTYVLDIGGGTTDIAIFGPKFKFLNGDSIRFGLLDLYKETRKAINRKFDVSISLEDAKKHLDGELQLLDEEFESDYRKPIILSGANNIISDFALEYPDAKTSNIIITGGGASKMFDRFKEKYPQAILVNDIYLNARSFFKIGMKKWIK